MVIVNADDFGMSPDINRAIVACFRENAISSASIMANMPAFEDAIHLARENGLWNRIGIHVNVTEGRPLSRRIAREPKFCSSNGEFAFRRNSIVFLWKNEREALREEIEAQIERCLAFGLRLSHLDSHHHVHTEWCVFNVIQPVIRKHGIEFVRAARNDNRGRHFWRAMYKDLFNIWLARAGFRRTRFFGDIDGFGSMRWWKGGVNGSFEIMVHPTFGSNGLIVDAVNGRSFVGIMKRLLGSVEEVEDLGV